MALENVTLPTRAGLRHHERFEHDILLLELYCYQKVDTGLKFLVVESVCEKHILICGPDLRKNLLDRSEGLDPNGI